MHFGCLRFIQKAAYSVTGTENSVQSLAWKAPTLAKAASLSNTGGQMFNTLQKLPVVERSGKICLRSERKALLVTVVSTNVESLNYVLAKFLSFPFAA